MEAEIIQYFKSDRSFAGGKALYSKCANKNLAVERNLNRKTNTPTNMGILHYELFKLTGKNQRLLKVLLSKPVETKEVENTIDLIPLKEEELTELLSNIGNKEQLDSFLEETKDRVLTPFNLLEKVKEKTEEILNISTTKEKVLDALDKAPVEAKQGIKLREQFPFLKGDTYPDAYKILVANLITARDKFVAAHPKLHDLVPEEELLQQTKDVVEPYEENKQILAELEYYQANGKPLGKHPIFEELAQEEKLKEMSADKLAKRRSNVENYIGKAEADLKKAKAENNDKKITSAKARIEKYTKEQAFITILLKTEK